ncbi:hypothetical protein B0H14DRAFT_2650979 [Mycena olivaceomarginata]|nr:hypothetical protein B0H14DRAFT_2650979 [Mycena olivaceomarginata]
MHLAVWAELRDWLIVMVIGHGTFRGRGIQNGLRWLLGGGHVLAGETAVTMGWRACSESVVFSSWGGISHASIPAGVSRTTSVSAPDLRGVAKNFRRGAGFNRSARFRRTVAGPVCTVPESVFTVKFAVLSPVGMPFTLILKDSQRVIPDEMLHIVSVEELEAAVATGGVG